MDHETDPIKQLIMYANDAVEGTFNDGTKVFLSPCATEYVIQQGHHQQGIDGRLVSIDELHLSIAVCCRSVDNETSNSVHDHHIPASNSCSDLLSKSVR